MGLPRTLHFVYLDLRPRHGTLTTTKCRMAPDTVRQCRWLQLISGETGRTSVVRSSSGECVRLLAEVATLFVPFWWKRIAGSSNVTTRQGSRYTGILWWYLSLWRDWGYLPLWCHTSFCSMRTKHGSSSRLRRCFHGWWQGFSFIPVCNWYHSGRPSLRIIAL